MTSNRSMLSIQATPDLSGIRTATLFEQEHTVIPCVALVEGVLWPANAPYPELALAEEFGRFPDGWNGRPVVYDHPKVDGVPVSANSPNVLDVNAIGGMYNTRLEDKKLKTEIWINQARVNSLPEEGQEVIRKLMQGEGPVEVSTGLFTMTEKSEGQYEGDQYEAIWRNIVPDHLAVLPDGITGACSVEDGCGAPRANSMKPVMRAASLGEPDLTTTTTTSNQLVVDQAAADCECGDTESMTEEGFIRKVLERYKALFGKGSEESIEEIVPVEVTENESTSDVQENAMNIQELVDGLVASERTQFTEEDAEWLSTLSEDQLTKLAPVVNEEASEEVTEETVEEVAPEVTEEVVEEAPAVNSRPVTTDDYIAAAPEEVREVLESGLRMHRARKAELVATLKSNSRCKFTEEQLNSKSVEELDTLAELAGANINYAGMASAPTTNASADDDVPAPPTIFAREADAA